MQTDKMFFRFKNLKLNKLEDKCFLHRIVAKKMGIVYCEYGKGWVHHNIKHKNEEFLYVLRGELKAHIKNKNKILKSGDGVLIPPHTAHSFVAVKKTLALVLFAPPITNKDAKAIMKRSKKINKVDLK